MGALGWALTAPENPGGALVLAASPISEPAGPATAQYQTMLTWIGRCIGLSWLYSLVQGWRA